MKIAIIGDSPLMLILANFLNKKGNAITIISDKKEQEEHGHTLTIKVKI